MVAENDDQAVLVGVNLGFQPSGLRRVDGAFGVAADKVVADLLLGYEEPLQVLVHGDEVVVQGVQHDEVDAREAEAVVAVVVRILIAKTLSGESVAVPKVVQHVAHALTFDALGAGAEVHRHVLFLIDEVAAALAGNVLEAGLDRHVALDEAVVVAECAEPR